MGGSAERSVDVCCERRPGAEEIRAQVWDLLATTRVTGQFVERRREQRYPFARLVLLTPVAEDGATPIGETFIVAGKQISEHGLGFFHPSPLPYRLVLARVERPDGKWLGFLLHLSWCRFLRHGWYESGGRFLQAVTAASGEGSAGETCAGASTTGVLSLAHTDHQATSSVDAGAMTAAN